MGSLHSLPSGKLRHRAALTWRTAVQEQGQTRCQAQAGQESHRSWGDTSPQGEQLPKEPLGSIRGKPELEASLERRCPEAQRGGGTGWARETVTPVTELVAVSRPG